MAFIFFLYTFWHRKPKENKNQFILENFSFEGIDDDFIFVLLFV